MNAITPHLTNPEMDFELVESSIRFLKNFSKTVSLSQENGEEKPVKIYCYSNVMKLRNDFNFHEHGFQFCALDSKAIEFARNFLTNPSGTVGRENRQHMMDWANQFLPLWGKENGIRGTFACVNFNYRSENVSDGQQRPFFLAHVDYAENDIANAMQQLKNRWKPLIEKVTGPLSEEKYRNLKIHTMLNLWMPLNELPTVNTLTVMDISSSKNLSAELIPATNAGTITALSLQANANQKWVAQTVMTLGNIVIFKSMRTPHAAVNIPGRFQGEMCDEYRKSLELRTLVLDLSD